MKACRACFDAQYTLPPSYDSRPAIEPVAITCPKPRACMCGISILRRRKTPMQLASIISRQSVRPAAPTGSDGAAASSSGHSAVSPAVSPAATAAVERLSAQLADQLADGSSSLYAGHVTHRVDPRYGQDRVRRQRWEHGPRCFRST